VSTPWDIQSPALLKRLEAVLGEDRATVALNALAPELAAWAEYENAINWHTECLSCANMLSSCITETVRAETAETALASARADLERSDEVQGEMNEKAIGYVREVARLKQQMEELSTTLDEAHGTDRAPLTAAERKFLHFALDQAAEEMSLGDGFTDADQAALDSLRRRAGKDER